jgi:hypothetical protein
VRDLPMMGVALLKDSTFKCWSERSFKHCLDEILNDMCWNQNHNKTFGMEGKEEKIKRIKQKIEG